MRSKLINAIVLSVALLTPLITNADNTNRTDKNASEPIPIEDIQRFTAAINEIKMYYVNQVDDQTLFENAIRGMLAGLDPHSAYLDEKDFAELRASTAGKFGGLGLEVGMEDGYIKVISPLDDTPASKAGVKPGDLIVRIDETPVKGLSLGQAVDLMRGDPGTKIKLLIVRKEESKPINLELIRQIIMVQSVKSKVIDNQYGYIRVSNFQERTSDDLQKAVQDIKQKQKLANQPVKGWILDLRNNPGGLLDSAIAISDAFLQKQAKYKDLIVYTKGRLPESQFQAKATPGDILDGAPMVVLINEGSASASEIVAGALQDYKRAIIVGTKTFGKGSVQTVLPLDDTRGLKLTTALYYTPAGRSIQATGITPDIIIKALQVNTATKEDDDVGYLHEADLPGHLQNAQKASAANSKNDDDLQSLASTDYQLHEAINVLRSIAVYKQN